MKYKLTPAMPAFKEAQCPKCGTGTLVYITDDSSQNIQPQTKGHRHRCTNATCRYNTYLSDTYPMVIYLESDESYLEDEAGNVVDSEIDNDDIVTTTLN